MSRSSRPRPWWFHLLRNAVPVAWLLLGAAVLAPAVRLVVWLGWGVRVWF